MWCLISSWNRMGGSMTGWYGFDEPRRRRRLRQRGQRIQQRRSERSRQRRRPDHAVGDRVIAAIGPVANHIDRWLDAIVVAH